jgi:hypothetical protein
VALDYARKGCPSFGQALTIWYSGYVSGLDGNALLADGLIMATFSRVGIHGRVGYRIVARDAGSKSGS